MQSYLCFHYTITALTEANMATINDLPCELLLDIFDSHILSGFDILRVAQTCQRWRSIFQTSPSTQRALWLRREKPFDHLQEPTRTPDQVHINVLVRRLPATIWNDYEENLWEMTWCQYDDMPTISLPRNPIVAELEEFLHLVNPYFVYQPPYKGCKVRAHRNEMRSLCFCGTKDLMAKTKGIDTSTNASWREMFISQHITRDVDVHFYIDVRYGARNFLPVANLFTECIRANRDDDDDDDVKMKDLISGMQNGMGLIWQALEKMKIEDLCGSFLEKEER
jgi:hypothetical protein